MQSKAAAQEYIDQLPDDKKQAMVKLREVMLHHLPEGFAEVMQHGMLGYVVPHSLYPNGYHANPAQPLPFISLAAQKNAIAVYHMGIYADMNLLAWFTDSYARHTAARPDMGKSCIRFKHPGRIPFGLLAELAAKVTPQQWIVLYERQLKKPAGQ